MKNIIYLSIFFLSFTLSVNAKKKLSNLQEATTYIKNVNAKKVGSDIEFTLSFSPSSIELASNQELFFNPIIEKGEKAVPLPAILLSSYKKDITNQRNNIHPSKEEVLLHAVKRKRNSTEEISYSYRVPYEPWMNGAELMLQVDECGCSDKVLFLKKDRLAVLNFPPIEFLPEFFYIEPKAIAQKTRQANLTSFLGFPVNKTHIIVDFQNNPLELKKITDLLDNIVADKDFTITELFLVGAASPEGPYAYNEKLAKERTSSLKNYIQKKYNLSNDQIKYDYIAENWDGLVQLINESMDLPYKTEALQIIESTDIFSGREGKLMRLGDGATFKYMREHMFPKLRKTDITVTYTIRGFNPEEAKELMWTSPQKLSLDEQYAVAKLYGVDTPEFPKVFETTVRMYPTEELAIINAATSALQRNDLVSAKEYLNKVSESTQHPEYFNTLAIFYAKEKQFDKAIHSINRAIELGLDEAQKTHKAIKDYIESFGL